MTAGPKTCPSSRTPGTTRRAPTELTVRTSAAHSFGIRPAWSERAAPGSLVKGTYHQFSESSLAEMAEKPAVSTPGGS